MPTLLSNGAPGSVNHQVLDQCYWHHFYTLLVCHNIGKILHRLWMDLPISKYIMSLMKPVKVTWVEIPGLCDYCFCDRL